jgi:hypothetical protein
VPVVFRRIEDVIKTEPDASRVAIQQERDDQCHSEQNSVNCLIGCREQQQASQVSEKDQRFGDYNVNVNCPDEIALLAHKNHSAMRAFEVHFE